MIKLFLLLLLVGCSEFDDSKKDKSSVKLFDIEKEYPVKLETIARFGHSTIVYKDHIWIMGGSTDSDFVNPETDEFTNSIYKSPDGVHWKHEPIDTKLGYKARWTKRADFGAVVFKDKVYVMGGYGTTDRYGELYYYNDIFVSKDAINYARIGYAPWNPRFRFACVTTNDYIYVIGGHSSNYECYKDVWRSKDGRLWEKLKEPLPIEFVDRTKVANGTYWGIYGHTASFYNNKIYVIGGSYPSGMTTKSIMFPQAGANQLTGNCISIIDNPDSASPTMSLFDPGDPKLDGTSDPFFTYNGLYVGSDYATKQKIRNIYYAFNNVIKRDFPELINVIPAFPTDLYFADVKYINEYLKIPNFYDKFFERYGQNKYGGLTWMDGYMYQRFLNRESDLNILIEETKAYRSKTYQEYDSLSLSEKYFIRRLNRLVIETLFNYSYNHRGEDYPRYSDYSPYTNLVPIIPIIKFYDRNRDAVSDCFFQAV